MKRCVMCFGTLIALLCVLATVGAQSPPNRSISPKALPKNYFENNSVERVRLFAGRYTTFDLLLIDAVETDLKLTPPQISKIEKLQRQSNALFISLLGDLYEPTGERPKIKTKSTETAQLWRLCDKQAIALLNVKQRKRYEEIRLQSMGALVVTDPAVLRLLALTVQQKQELVLACQEYWESYLHPSDYSLDLSHFTRHKPAPAELAATNRPELARSGRFRLSAYYF